MQNYSHHLFSLLQDGKLYSAPVRKDIERALDIGTGTGIWAMDFAAEFTNTTVLGTRPLSNSAFRSSAKLHI
jgi:methylase of polypeptide subunit release factors